MSQEFGRIAFVYVDLDRVAGVIRALGPHLDAVIVRDERGLLASLSGRGPALLVVDLELVCDPASLSAIERAMGAGWRVVADCTMTPRGMTAVLRVARSGLAGALLRGEDREQHAAELRRAAVPHPPLLFLGALSQHATRMNPRLQLAAIAMCCGAARVRTVGELARLTGRSRRWVEAQLGAAGIRSVRAFINASLVARAHPDLVSPVRSLSEVAQTTGLGTARTAKRLIETLVGTDIGTVRHGMPARELAERLCRGITAMEG